MIYLDGAPIKPTLFPDQTSQVWNVESLNNKTTSRVTWEFDSEREFIHVAQLKTLLDSKGIKAVLHMPYLPYARQDKPVANHNTFALTTFANLINSLNFEAVFAIDPHSDIPKELIKNFTAILPVAGIHVASLQTNAETYCYPDSGALKKYGQYCSAKKFVYGEKVRNQQTGKIESMNLVGDVKDKNVLIVDDICDGGGTFCWMAQLLYENGAKEVNLYISHGIFSKGLRPLKEANIKRIFTIQGEISEVQGNICYKEI